MLVLSACGTGQAENGSPIGSTYNAKELFEIAHELHTWPGADSGERTQAMVMLNAVYEMDNNADYIFPEVIDLAIKSRETDYSDAVLLSLRKYLRSDSDLVAAMKAAKYLIGQQNTREQREAVIGLLTNQVGARNNVFASEMATELGFLYIEKADIETAMQLFNSAYQKNPYNDLAFEKIIELSGSGLNPVAITAHHRFMLTNNPLNIDAAMSLAGSLYELGLYNESFMAWQYTVDLLEYAGDVQVPADVYLQWAMSALRSDGNLSDALQIAAKYRQIYGQNIVMEVLAARAAKKLSDQKLAKSILEDAEKRALEDESIDPAMMAWFYGFGKSDPQAALAWANRANSAEPNDPDVQAIFGYAMVLNGEHELARMQVADVPDSQIKLLATAKVALNNDDKPAALEDLKKLIAMNPGSIEAQVAIQLLDQLNSAYIPQNDPREIRRELQNVFGNSMIGKFIKPEDRIKYGIKTEGNEFSFDHDIQAELIITNNSENDMIVNETGLFKGQVVFSANLTGDIKAKIPELLRIKKWPSEPIKPGNSMIIPVKIVTGPLREILYSYPQAGFEIELTAYLDPIEKENRQMQNYISNLKPAMAKIKRNPVHLSNRYLQSRLEAINNGQQGQVIRSVRLFAGLLAEQSAFKRMKKPLYRLLYAEPPLLKSAIAKALRSDNWTIQFQTLLTLQFVPIKHEIASVLGELIQDDQWPVRMMALNLLANSQQGGFEKVLDWAAINDPHRLVKQMAVALGGKADEESVKN